MGITTKKMCELAGLTTRQVNNWIEHKWIKPENKYHGPGYSYTWGPDQVAKACLMARLIKATGMLPNKASTIAGIYFADVEAGAHGNALIVTISMGEGISIAINRLYQGEYQC